MNKFCPNCGNELSQDAGFCNKCGAAQNVTQAADQSANQTTGQTINQNFNQNIYTTPAPTLAKREIIVAILLSIVTCGIYGIYWFIVMTDDANKVSGDNGTSGGMAVLFTILTCGIYGFYWYYKMGQKLYLAGKTYNKDINDNSVLYLILGFFGLSIVSYCLIQSDLNKFAA